MVTFRSNNSNNNRRPPFRNNNNRRPSFRNNNEGSKFSNNDNFQRKVPGRNNHNAVKLIEKYNDLAREALANEDKILSENYFQHADHFKRILNEQENHKKERFSAEAVEAEKNNKDQKIDEKIKKDETKEEEISPKEEFFAVRKKIKQSKLQASNKSKLDAIKHKSFDTLTSEEKEFLKEFTKR